MFEKWQANRKIKMNEKKAALRKKNAALRAAGKDPTKGWGTMVHTEVGGFNKANPIDTKAYLIEKQKLTAENAQKKQR